MEAVIKDIQDTLTVTERLLIRKEQLSEDRRETAKLRRESAKFQKRTEQNLAEITDKLNRPVGNATQ